MRSESTFQQRRVFSLTVFLRSTKRHSNLMYFLKIHVVSIIHISVPCVSVINLVARCPCMRSVVLGNFQPWQRPRSSERVQTCDSADSCWLYSAVPLGDQATGILIWYSTQSHYPDTRPTSPCLSIIMSSAWLGSSTYHLLGNWFEAGALLIRPPRLVPVYGVEY